VDPYVQFCPSLEIRNAESRFQNCEPLWPISTGQDYNILVFKVLSLESYILPEMSRQSGALEFTRVKAIVEREWDDGTSWSVKIPVTFERQKFNVERRLRSLIRFSRSTLISI
jgi:hypothetical protein